MKIKNDIKHRWRLAYYLAKATRFHDYGDKYSRWTTGWYIELTRWSKANPRHGECGTSRPICTQGPGLGFGVPGGIEGFWATQGSGIMQRVMIMMVADARMDSEPFMSWPWDFFRDALLPFAAAKRAWEKRGLSFRRQGKKIMSQHKLRVGREISDKMFRGMADIIGVVQDNPVFFNIMVGDNCLAAAHAKLRFFISRYNEIGEREEGVVVISNRSFNALRAITDLVHDKPEVFGGKVGDNYMELAYEKLVSLFPLKEK